MKKRIKKQITCAYCSATINRRIRNKLQINFFCSNICSSAFNRKGKLMLCLACGKETYQSATITNRGWGNFCSSACSATYNNSKRTLNGYSTKNKLKILTCILCAKQTETSLHARKICKECYLAAEKQRSLPKNKNCVTCNIIFKARTGKYCKSCLSEKRRIIGSNSAKSQGDSKRSKNEIYFANLCRSYFKEVKENEIMFLGFDADVVIEDLKIAISWNGIWHYQKVAKKHSVAQVQARDKVKNHRILASGYTHHVIKDMGKHNTKFVEEEFYAFLEKFCRV